MDLESIDISDTNVCNDKSVAKDGVFRAFEENGSAISFVKDTNGYKTLDHCQSNGDNDQSSDEMYKTISHSSNGSKTETIVSENSMESFNEVQKTDFIGICDRNESMVDGNASQANGISNPKEDECEDELTSVGDKKEVMINEVGEISGICSGVETKLAEWGDNDKKSCVHEQSISKSESFQDDATNGTLPTIDVFLTNPNLDVISGANKNANDIVVQDLVEDVDNGKLEDISRNSNELLPAAGNVEEEPLSADTPSHDVEFLEVKNEILTNDVISLQEETQSSNGDCDDAPNNVGVDGNTEFPKSSLMENVGTHDIENSQKDNKLIENKINGNFNCDKDDIEILTNDVISLQEETQSSNGDCDDAPNNVEENGNTEFPKSSLMENVGTHDIENSQKDNNLIENKINGNFSCDKDDIEILTNDVKSFQEKTQNSNGNCDDVSNDLEVNGNIEFSKSSLMENAGTHDIENSQKDNNVIEKKFDGNFNCDKDDIEILTNDVKSFQEKTQNSNENCDDVSNDVEENGNIEFSKSMLMYHVDTHNKDDSRKDNNVIEKNLNQNYDCDKDTIEILQLSDTQKVKPNQSVELEESTDKVIFELVQENASTLQFSQENPVNEAKNELIQDMFCQNAPKFPKIQDFEQTDVASFINQDKIGDIVLEPSFEINREMITKSDVSVNTYELLPCADNGEDKPVDAVSPLREVVITGQNDDDLVNPQIIEQGCDEENLETNEQIEIKESSEDDKDFRKDPFKAVSSTDQPEIKESELEIVRQAEDEKNHYIEKIPQSDQQLQKADVDDKNCSFNDQQDMGQNQLHSPSTVVESSNEVSNTDFIVQQVGTGEEKTSYADGQVLEESHSEPPSIQVFEDKLENHRDDLELPSDHEEVEDHSDEELPLTNSHSSNDMSIDVNVEHKETEELILVDATPTFGSSVKDLSFKDTDMNETDTDHVRSIAEENLKGDDEDRNSQGQVLNLSKEKLEGDDEDRISEGQELDLSKEMLDGDDEDRISEGHKLDLSKEMLDGDDEDRISQGNELNIPVENLEKMRRNSLKELTQQEEHLGWPLTMNELNNEEIEDNAATSIVKVENREEISENQEEKQPMDVAIDGLETCEEELVKLKEPESAMFSDVGEFKPKSDIELVKPNFLELENLKIISKDMKPKKVSKAIGSISGTRYLNPIKKNDSETIRSKTIKKNKPVKKGGTKKEISLKKPTTPTKTSPGARSPATPTSNGTKKVPPSKAVVGLVPGPNPKAAKSKIGSMQNIKHKPGGGNVKVESKKLGFGEKAKPKIGSTDNIKYKPGGGDKKMMTKKLDWKVQSKIGSLDNAAHKPGGGQKKIESKKLDFKSAASSKVGSRDNIKHSPGSSEVKIESHKLDFKVKASSKVGSFDNVKHVPAGGDVKIYNEKIEFKERASSRIGSLTTQGRASDQSPTPSTPDSQLKSEEMKSPSPQMSSEVNSANPASPKPEPSNGNDSPQPKNNTPKLPIIDPSSPPPNSEVAGRPNSAENPN